jgi:serine/threonine-protein kinase
MKECPACKLCFPDDVLRCPNDGDPTNHTITGEPVLDGRYQLIKRLGQGGMGVVYKARHTYLKTAHAIKIILPDLVGNDPNLVTRFRQEALAAAAIRHRNIVSVTDFGVVAGKMPFLVMEHVEGEALHDLLVREKRLTPQYALEILSAICSGLSAAHKQDIVHRDLKPLNIMIVRDLPVEDAVKILDFGLAKIKSGELLGSFIQAQTTGLMGSPYYMAPEQWSDDEPDARADVYSLGVILYQMLAGDVPFKGTSIPSIMRKHLSEPPPPLADFGLNLPPSIEKVVRHALEKDPAERTPSVERLTQEFREALANPLAAVPAQPKTPEQTIKKTKTEPLPKAAANASKTFAAAGEPSATLRVLTNPPESLVFLNGEKLGTSEANGWLVAENIRRGKHKLRVVKNNHTAFEAEIACDGEVCQTVAQLQNLAATSLPPHLKPDPLPKNAIPQETFVPPAQTKTEKTVGKTNVPAAAPELDLSMPLSPPETVQKPEQRAAQPFAIKSYPDAREPEAKPETKREAVKTDPEVAPLNTLKSLNNSSKISVPIPATEIESEPSSGINIPVLAAAFIIGMLIVAGGGIAAYLMMFPTTVQQKTDIPQPSNSPIQNPQENPPTANLSKIEMVAIPGGSFMMGVDRGQDAAEPAHKVTVADFQMSKYEITNTQYEQFIKETGHEPPGNWGNGRYLNGEENFPVTTVTFDDALAYAKWLSQKNGVEYSLPSESQWEYAARNGAAGNLFPWGNKWEDGRAVMNGFRAKSVGSSPNGANKWGVQDLIGNVWEWTNTTIEAYPGREMETGGKDPGKVIRGGSYFEKSDRKPFPVNSVFRSVSAPSDRSNLVGIRLVIN